MQASTVSFLVAGAGIGGILLGHYLTRSWQHEQWLRDKRYDDYQTVLSAITAAYLAITRVNNATFTSMYTEDMARELEVIKADAFRVLHDRIFIAGELRNAAVMKKWLYVLDSYHQPGKQQESGAAFSALTAELASMAISKRSARI
jgi:hypothetical protein